MIGLDEPGPEAAKGFLGTEPIRPGPAGARRGRANREVDAGRRGSGYGFGAFRPATGEALTAPYRGRTIADRVDFPDRVDAWLDPAAERAYAILDNLSTRRELVFQPAAAAYRSLSEPRRKALRSLALKGRRFATRAEVCRAVEPATACRNARRHPFARGRRQRRRRARATGVARLPLAA